MDNEQINIAIAEARGLLGPWTQQITPCGCDGQWDLFNSDGVRLADYCNDLNSMHEALMMQTPELRTRFRNELQYIIAPETKPSKASGICLMGPCEYDLWFFATARQRAEAFLRTIDKWEE